MTLIAITWARNEADIIEEFVRYHCQIVDHLFIILHRSTDESFGILTRLQQEGLPITLQENALLEHRQGPALTELLHTICSTRAPEWILPLDADEFLIGAEHIATLPTDCITLLPWKTYVPTIDDDPLEKKVLRRITHRCAVEPQQFYKVLIPFVLVKGTGAQLPLGSHVLHDVNGKPSFPSKKTQNMHLAHFPVRSEPQLRPKIVNGLRSLRCNAHWQSGQGFHWEKLRQRCEDPTPMSLQELENIASSYTVLSPAFTPQMHHWGSVK